MTVEAGAGVQIALVCFGLAAPVATYWIAASPLDQGTKVTLLVGLSVIYLVICIWTISQLRKIRAGAGSFADAAAGSENANLEDKLAALEDAREFFGTSLKPADMFRLVSNRVNEIVPYASAVLITKTGQDQFRINNAFGSNAEGMENAELTGDIGLAAIAFLSGEVEIIEEIGSEPDIFPAGSLDDLRSSAAIPLCHEGDVFAVMQLFFRERTASGSELISKLEAIGERVAPLFLGSLAFERSLSKALTDPLTNLPNERAFYMVLENQLAESHRFRDERPLTVLAIDIQNFDDLNHAHGHAFGDKALSFAAMTIASQLRKMDFLARSMNDEFLVVLPKASDRTASEIISRIRLKLAETPLAASDEESVKVWLNFGWASFWKDGESVQQLVQSAYLRKQQSKTSEPANVVSFPKEYVN